MEQNNRPRLLGQFSTWAVLSLFLFGCASFTKSTEVNLPMAMKAQTRAELIDTFGNPDDKEVNGATEIWHYQVYSSDSLHVYPYIAKLEGDKVVSFEANTSALPEKSARSKRMPSGQR